jgi:acetyl-CoA C-acetyltransferase
MGSVWIAGSYRSDFARNYAREGLEISDMVAEALQGTLRSAGLEPEDVEFIHVGNAFGQLFTGQGQLGAMPATAEPRLWGKPAARHEAACASGSVAVLAATAEIDAGQSWKAVENGELERDGAIPVNPSGGLIGVGHPVGATGVRMLHDAARQVTGQAGDCQVDGARAFATLNIGGSLTTTVSFVVTRED